MSLTSPNCTDLLVLFKNSLKGISALASRHCSQQKVKSNPHHTPRVDPEGSMMQDASTGFSGVRKIRWRYLSCTGVYQRKKALFGLLLIALYAISLARYRFDFPTATKALLTARGFVPVSSKLCCLRRREFQRF